MFPFSFISSAFVPTESMPGWLQVYANHSPMTTAVNSLRGLFNGTPVASDVIATIAWSVGILLLFATLSVRKYLVAVALTCDRLIRQTAAGSSPAPGNTWRDHDSCAQPTEPGHRHHCGPA